MGADSSTRRLARRFLGRLLSEDLYSYVQCAAKAMDIRRGSWSEPELDIALAATRSGDTVLDVGANFGLYCYHLSKAVGSTGRVVAFEPVPFTAKTLRRVCSVLRLGNVEVVDKGCSDAAGRVTFSVPVTATGTLSTGLAHISSRTDDHPGKEAQVRWEATESVDVDLVRLDDCFESVQDLSFMKLDIEGAEPLALAGAVRLLRQHMPVLVVEINPFYLAGFDKSVSDVVDPLYEVGYRMYRYDAGCKRLDRVATDDVQESNYVFVHPDRSERLRSFFPHEE